MKKLFLASSGLAHITEFIGVEPSAVTMLFIPTAGNLDEDVWWIDKDRDVLSKMGFVFREFDIENASPGDVSSALEGIDIVYVAGGNTFHLLSQIRLSGFDKQLTNFVESGGMYAGASAGALIAGADIGPVVSIDEPEKVSGLGSTVGLRFVEFVPIPHYDMSDRTQQIDAIKAEYSERYKIVVLTDDQAIVVKGDAWKIVESKRSELEMEWFDKAK